MSGIVTTYLWKAGGVVPVSELAKRGDKLGALAFVARRFGVDLL